MSTNKNTVKLYWEQVRKRKLTFFTMLIAIPIGALLIDTLLPYFLAQAIGGLTESNQAIVSQALWLATGVGVAGAILNLWGFQAMVQHESYVRADLGQSTFNRIINKDLRFFVDTKVGALTSRYIDFVRAEITLQDLLIIRTLGFILSVGVGLVILFTASPAVAGIIGLLVVILILQIRWSIKKRAPYRHERKELTGKIHGHVADSVTNNLVVKTFAGEQREIKALHALHDRYRVLYKKDFGFITYEGSARVALMVIIQIIAIAVAAHMVFAGQLTVAVAIFILAYLQRIGSQLFILGDILNGYDQALLDAAPMSDMLTSKLHVTDAPNARPLVVANPSIELRDVSYAYSDGDENVINNISVTIPAGQKVGLVGHSGSGKTTITHLLLRFDDVTSGAILIDGQDTSTVTQESLRQTIAYVPQEPMLFHRSLRENIAYGRPNASDAEIRKAAKQANALSFIEQLPHGFDTLVGERGVKLSGGQRQRIAIARAILKDAPILILDEATSALDSESEKYIQQALENLMKNKTSIVIAHRLSTIAKLDRILVLDNGQIAEDGTHTELLSNSGTYARLWKHQSGGFIEE